MLALPTLVAALPAQPDPQALLGGFVPPRRFADTRFADYHPDERFPSQKAALARLRALAADLLRQSRPSLMRQLRSAFGQPGRGGGVYLDGGFGVGKTHLLAALWNAAPAPRAYLSFDELVYAVGLLGVQGARDAFRAHRLVCVDEWELDDPGNLKLALAFLRGALADGVWVAATSNTVPDELGRGRFSQKDFAAEIEELAASFDTMRVEGEDFRHRHFRANPGREAFLDPVELATAAASAGPRALLAAFPELQQALREVHPIRFADLAKEIDALFVRDLAPLANLPDALRWVHWIDKLYDAEVALAASSQAALGDLIPGEFLVGAYARKFGRCLSRMEEMLGETGVSPS